MTRAAKRDALIVLVVALAARVGVCIWGTQFPPTADGTFYDKIARRIAEGEGYTWLWPDGTVTFAAHYPVGFPAFAALAYRLFGATPSAVMVLGALVGTASCVAFHGALVRQGLTPRRALLAALVYALHPALLPYGIALMTEGLTVSLLVLAFAALVHAAESASLARAWRPLVLAGAMLGLATLVRPQCIVLAPLGAFAVSPTWRLRVRNAALVSVMAASVCLPWTARNCARIHRCALVSVNGGWNLLIGTQTQNGAWQEVGVPPPCREVWDEAGKDACFGDAAQREILASPAAWVARVPQKLAVTFDYFGGAPWYLHASNPTRFTERDKIALGAVETVVSRALLLAAAVAVALSRTRRPPHVYVLAAIAALCALTRHAWPGYLALAVLCAVRDWGAPRDAGNEPAQGVMRFTAVHVLATAALHATFFGAGRYGLVVVPFVTALAFLPPKRD